MDSYWIPGVNQLNKYGRWAFVELTDLYAMQNDFEQKLYDYFDTNHQDVLEELKSEYSDEIAASLKTSLEKFKGTYSS